MHYYVQSHIHGHIEYARGAKPREAQRSHYASRVRARSSPHVNAARTLESASPRHAHAYSLSIQKRIPTTIWPELPLLDDPQSVPRHQHQKANSSRSRLPEHAATGVPPSRQFDMFVQR